MQVQVMCKKFECREDIHYKTQTWPVAKNAAPRPSGWESNTRSLDYQNSALPLSYRSRCRQLEREFSIYINEMVMPVKYKGILVIIFGIYTHCQQMKFRVMCRKFECREDIHYKTQTRTSCEKWNSKVQEKNVMYVLRVHFTHFE